MIDFWIKRWVRVNGVNLPQGLTQLCTQTTKCTLLNGHINVYSKIAIIKNEATRLRTMMTSYFIFKKVNNYSVLPTIAL